MSLKLNMYVKNVGVVNNNIEKLILNIILWSFGTLVFFYLLFLGNMVKNIIERQSFETEARTLSNEVRDLESTYLSMSNNINLTFSYSLGFKNIEPTFATREALGLLPADQPFDTIKTVQNDI